MNIGDRVRLLHEKEEGVIRNIIDNRLVEVEIEDGFIIPVLKKELVLIASHEKEVQDLYRHEVDHKGGRERIQACIG